jgi:hypothetical protein
MAEEIEAFPEKGGNSTWMKVHGTGYIRLAIQNREADVYIYLIDIWGLRICIRKLCNLRGKRRLHSKSLGFATGEIVDVFGNIRPGPRFFMNFRNKLIFYGEELLAPRANPSWRGTPCRLSATAYSIFPAILRPLRPLHSQPEDASCCCDKGPT